MDVEKIPSHVDLETLQRRIRSILAEEHSRGGRPSAGDEGYRLFRELFEEGDTARLLIEPHSGIILAANAPACETFGLDRNTVSGKPFSELSSSPPSEIGKHLSAALEDRNPSGEFSFQAKDGTTQSIEVHSRRLELAGFPVVLSQFRDHSGANLLGDSFHLSGEEFSQFIDTTTDGIVCLELNPPLDLSLPHDELARRVFREHRIIGCNKAFMEYYRVSSRGEILGKRLDDLAAHERPESERLENLERFFSRGCRLDRIRSPEVLVEGERRVFSKSLVGLARDGCLHQVWCIQRDITEQVESEERLYLQNAHLELLFEDDPEALVLVNMENIVTKANREFVRLFGFSPGEIIGKPNELIVPEGYEEESADIFRRVSSGEKVTLETVRRTHDGELVDVAILGSPIKVNGVLSGTFWVYQNISERKRSERVREALYRISEAISTTGDLVELMEVIHGALGSLVDTRNFFVALYHPEDGNYSFPFFVDERDSVEAGQRESLEGSLTDYVRRTGSSLLLADGDASELERAGEVKLVGPPTRSWLGVPLKTAEEIIGVVVVQSYERQGTFGEDDRELLESVSGSLATAIERKRASDALQASEHLYKTLFNQSPTGVFRFDCNSVLTDCNEQLIRIMRSTREKLIGLKLDLLKQKNVGIGIKKALAGNEFSFEGPYQTTTSDTQLYISASLRPLYDPDGNVIGGMGALVDLTDRIKAEEAAKLQRTYLERLFESAPEAIALVDPEDRVVRINQEFTRLFGYEEKEAAGRRINDLIVPPHLREEGLALTAEAAHGERLNVETVRQAKDGRLIDVSILATLVVLEGNRIGLYGIYRDISERKRTEKLQNALFHISDATNASQNLEELLAGIRATLGELLDTSNFYVALYNESEQSYSFPICVDETVHFEPGKGYDLQGGMTDYVRRNGRARLLDRKSVKRLIKKGELSGDAVGIIPAQWLGAPLTSAGAEIGVVAVQSYDDGSAYSEEDLELLEFVSDHIALAIERTRAAAALAEEKERLAVTLHSIGEGVIATDTEGRIILFSHVAEKLIGAEESEVIGQPLEEVYHVRGRETKREAGLLTTQVLKT
ncbi:MAG TPA: PAS domain S-box protein, partial [Bacteroidetes bacterium]|nr:PAS domain S-box protein [Bacteroidota bacterium]